jgi:hypothetical protein
MEGAPTMEVALMIPCYIDVFYPQVGIATIELLERLGVDVVYPKEQTCCGQPMANSGCYEEARCRRPLRSRFWIFQIRGHSVWQLHSPYSEEVYGGHGFTRVQSFSLMWNSRSTPSHSCLTILSLYSTLTKLCGTFVRLISTLFQSNHTAFLMTGASGSADIGGTTVHPAQGVKA